MSKKSFGYYFLLLLTIIFFLFKDSNAQTFDTAYARKLQNAINTLRTNNNLVGISAAAYVPGQGLWQGVSGISETGVNLTPDYVFMTGSVMKNFVATIILQLEEADSLSIDDKLYQWLPRYNNIDSNITLKQLLNHTSGIYNFTDNPAFQSAMNSNLNRYWTPEEIVSQFVLPRNFAAGASWRYCNTSYVLLGMIISKITGTNLSQQLHTRFFTPLGMTSSFFEPQDTVTAPYAHNWVDLNGDGILDDASFIPRTAIFSSTVGSSGIVTTSESLIKWGRNLYGGSLLSQASRNKMLTFISMSSPGINGYGLGTFRYSVGGKLCYGHGGNLFGYSCMYMYYPQDSICISLMINRDVDTGPIAVSFMDKVLTFRPVGIQNISTENPAGYNLSQNFPNPFNPETNINFFVPQTSIVKLNIYNSLGKKIQSIFEGKLSSGTYTYKWSASDFPSGVYFYKLEANNFTSVKKMTLIK